MRGHVGHRSHEQLSIRRVDRASSRRAKARASARAGAARDWSSGSAIEKRCDERRIRRPGRPSRRRDRNRGDNRGRRDQPRNVRQPRSGRGGRRRPPDRFASPPGSAAIASSSKRTSPIACQRRLGSCRGSAAPARPAWDEDPSAGIPGPARATVRPPAFRQRVCLKRLTPRQHLEDERSRTRRCRCADRRAAPSPVRRHVRRRAENHARRTCRPD